MQMPKCMLHTTCKYFLNQAKIVHFRVKHRFVEICKETLFNEQKSLMCNKVNTQEFMLIVRSGILYHTCDLVHSLSVEFKLHDFNF